jgi:phosphotransferase system enzyme I (PtsI)
MLATALIGMGITSLSMAAAAVRPVGAQLARVTMQTCAEAAEAALSAADPMSGREAVRAVLTR